MSTGDAFPTSPSPVTSDMHFFLADVASGLDWKDTDGSTDLTSADAGDVARFDGTDWVKQGNIRGPSGEDGADGAGSSDGPLTFTALTGADKSFTAPGSPVSTQIKALYDTNITFPTDAANDQSFMLSVITGSGDTRLFISKQYMAELAASSAIAWDGSIAGVTPVQTPGDTKNVYFYPIGNNRGIVLGISNEDPPALLWGASHTGITPTFQLYSVQSGTAAGQQSPDGVAALTADYVHTLYYKYAEDEPSAHAANWRFDDEWSNTDGPSSDSWYNTAAGCGDQLPAESRQRQHRRRHALGVPGPVPAAAQRRRRRLPVQRFQRSLCRLGRGVLRGRRGLAWHQDRRRHLAAHTDAPGRLGNADLHRLTQRR